MKKSQKLKILIGVEIVMLVCLCWGAAGVLVYAGGLQWLAGPGNSSGGAAFTPPAVDFLTSQAVAPTPVPAAQGVTLELLPDGMIRCRDLDGHYEIRFPSGWLVVRPGNAAEGSAALTLLGVENPLLAERLKADLGGADLRFDRLLAYPRRPDLLQDGVLGILNVVFDAQNGVKLDNAALGAWVRTMEASSAMPGFRVTASSTLSNSNQVPLMLVKGRYIQKNAGGEPVPLAVMVLFFKPAPGSLVRVTFTVLQAYQDQFLPEFELIRESILVPLQ